MISFVFRCSQSGAVAYMVAFAGRRYAARSIPIFVADNDNIVTSFTLVTQIFFFMLPLTLGCEFILKYNYLGQDS